MDPSQPGVQLTIAQNPLLACQISSLFAVSCCLPSLVGTSHGKPHCLFSTIGVQAAKGSNECHITGGSRPLRDKASRPADLTLQWNLQGKSSPNQLLYAVPTLLGSLGVLNVSYQLSVVSAAQASWIELGSPKSRRT